jgi:glutathione S-transferase
MEDRMAKVEILGMPVSNYVWTTRIACAEKGIEHELVNVRPHSPEIDAIHPLGKMPVLRHGDVELFESKAILTYIDKAFDGPALAPTDAVGAAQVEQWTSFVNTATDPAIMRAYLVPIVFAPGGIPDRAKIDAAVPGVERQMEILDKAVARTGYLVGNSFTIADMTLVPILAAASRFPESGAALAKRPNLQKYLQTHVARESVRKTAPPPPKG